MDEIFQILFVDNPRIAEKVYEFFEKQEDYQELERKYQAMENEICQQIGYERFDAFEEMQSRYISKLANAYYLFGLGLRQELIRELF